MLKYILIGFVVLIAIFVVVVIMRPDDFKVSRSATVAAPPATIYPHVNDLHQFQVWSPFAKLDTNSKLTYSGPESGQGASFAWAGNSQVGEGSMTCTESKPNELLVYRLDFLKPFKGTNTAEFSFKPQGDQTVVTWSMSGKCNFVTKAIGIFMDCDKMVGPQFEKGLADLKGLSEAEAKK